MANLFKQQPFLSLVLLCPEGKIIRVDALNIALSLILIHVSLEAPFSMVHCPKSLPYRFEKLAQVVMEHRCIEQGCGEVEVRGVGRQLYFKRRLEVLKGAATSILTLVNTCYVV